MSGYRDCACRDCFEIAIGERGALCHACQAADCTAFEGECRAAGAYGANDDIECDSCGNRTDDHVGSVCRPCHAKERRDDIALSQWKERFRA